MVELRATEINALIARKLLEDEKRDDLDAVKDALYAWGKCDDAKQETQPIDRREAGQ
jgi:hypothetical protein